MHGIVGNNPANDPDKKPVNSRSEFHPGLSAYQTALFGMYTPMFGYEVVAGDKKFSIRVASDVDTFTLKAPLMQPIKMNKDYFFASLRALLPHNAELLITNPLTGDDVVAEDVNCVVRPYDLVNALKYHCTRLSNLIKATITTVPATSQEYIHGILSGILGFYATTWFLLSDGSLASQFGYGFSGLFRGPVPSGIGRQRLSYDEFLELIFSFLMANVESFTVKGYDGLTVNSYASANPTAITLMVSNSLGEDSSRVGTNFINFRRLLELIQQGFYPTEVTVCNLRSNAPDASITVGSWYPSSFDDQTAFLDFAIEQSTTLERTTALSSRLDSKPINLLKLVAYQLAGSQFYSNDAVDYVYNPSLWHQNMFSLACAKMSDGGAPLRYYLLNGHTQEYDSVSGHVLYYLLTNANKVPAWISAGAVTNPHTWCLAHSGVNADGQLYGAYAYMINLFGYLRALRFRDYFVGSKTRPMAVGNVDVTVTGGQFSVVDVTKNIQRQRFLNQVNRVGRTMTEYVRGIFGADPTFDPHQLIFLGSSTDVIGASETENTGAAQYSDKSGITSKLRNDSSRFAFEGAFNEPGVIIGVMSFDTSTPYPRITDRENFHIDRFDMFNPYLQTIGDQDVAGEELSLNQPNQSIGYQLRYAEYKQKYDRVSGGFLGFLPGYAFVRNLSSFVNVGSNKCQISPNFIRHLASEFDQFYLSLSNMSPAGYFHFIVRNDIEVSASRPMLAAPSIL